MILYDQTTLGGYGVLFHVAGSPLFLYRTIIPALLSATLTVICSENQALNDYLTPRLTQAAGYFGSISFLLGMMLVTRTTRAVERFQYASTQVVTLQTTLYQCALCFDAWLPVCDEKKGDGESAVVIDRSLNRALRAHLFRYLRAIQILAFEEFQGLLDSEHRCDTLTDEESAMLIYEHKKAGRVLHWLFKLTAAERSKFTIGDPQMTVLFRNLHDVNLAYNSALRIAETPYPFPLAQVSVFICNVFACLSPFVWGVMYPDSNGFSFFVAFFIVWIVFAVNESAVSLESPYDDSSNDLPLAYYSLRFHEEMLAVELTTPPAVVVVTGQNPELPQDERSEKREKMKQRVLHDVSRTSLKKRLARWGGHSKRLHSIFYEKCIDAILRKNKDDEEIPGSVLGGKGADAIRGSTSSKGVLSRVYALQDLELTNVRMKGNYSEVR